MIDMNMIVGWMFAVVTALSPQDPTAVNQEDPEARSARMSSIAQDIAEVVFDESEDPLFSGYRGREKSAIFVATWAAHESNHFEKSVDVGTKRGDNGSSWCLMQRHIGRGKTPEGWSGKDLVNDRKKCILSGYRVMKYSWRTCRGPELARGAMYISGRCNWAVGQSVTRSQHALRLFKEYNLESYVKSIEAPSFDPLLNID